MRKLKRPFRAAEAAFLFSGLFSLCCDRRAQPTEYLIESPSGQRSIRIVVTDEHQATVEMMIHGAFWHGWSLTNRNVTHLWAGWAPGEDFLSVAVCDGSGDGNSHIERFSSSEIHVGAGGLGENFQESDAVLVSTLRQAFGRHAEANGTRKTDPELLNWFCDAPGREEFLARFRPNKERKISLVQRD